jgi:fatty acid desaturase
MGALPVRLEPMEVRRLSRLRTTRAVLHIALEWGAILLAAWLCWTFWHPLVYLVAVAFIGARQHALLILMHDASHYRLAPDRRVNDWLGEILLAWPFFAITLRAYRRSHFLHHRFVNTERDPDWVRKQNADWDFPMHPLALARILAMNLFGAGLLRQVRYAREVSSPDPGNEPERPRGFGPPGSVRVILAALLLVLLTAGGLWKPFLLFWVVPFATWTQLVLHVRSIAEHFAIPGSRRSGAFAETRNTVAGVLDRIFVAPKHVGLHLDHHLYPSVPFYRLPELHTQLCQDARYRASAHESAGYWQVLRECVRPGPSPTSTRAGS